MSDGRDDKPDGGAGQGGRHAAGPSANKGKEKILVGLRPGGSGGRGIAMDFVLNFSEVRPARRKLGRR